MMKPKNGKRMKPGLATVLLFGALVTGIFIEAKDMSRMDILMLWLTIGVPYAMGLMDGKSA